MTSTERGSRLPPLPPASAEHSRRVTARVEDAIRATANGFLPFDEFLQLVQYAPGIGYYSAGSEKFGPGGDFTTAPELSPLFGRCVGRQCGQVLAQLPAATAQILELGAGSGALAEQVLRTLHATGQLPVRYLILEVSADLRERQRRRLSTLPGHLFATIEWLEALPSTPFNGVILANEVVDALPFKRFLLRAGQVEEVGIALAADGSLVEAAMSADAATRAEVAKLIGWAEGDAPDPYASELCPMLHAWIAALAAPLRQGALLLIDYGLSRSDYYHPQRNRGTLRCHYRHRAHDDALLHVGLQDISAWVDFTRVAEAGAEAGLSVDGYCTQAAFLLATGIEQDLAGERPALDQARLASQARVLLLPGEMGENFKVMALTRALDGPLDGFRYQDLRGTL
jgi:SAM-dependent MidA family methyltransferase